MARMMIEAQAEYKIFGPEPRAGAAPAYEAMKDGA
jgi:hypothetical protein